MDNYDNLTTDLKAAFEALDRMEREMKEVEETLLKLIVRSYLLEVALATQFGPNIGLYLEKLEESCEACANAVNNETLCLFEEDQGLGVSVESQVDDSDEQNPSTNTEMIVETQRNSSKQLLDRPTSLLPAI